MATIQIKREAADPKVGFTSGELQTFVDELDRIGAPASTRIRVDVLGFRSQIKVLEATIDTEVSA